MSNWLEDRTPDELRGINHCPRCYSTSPGASVNIEEVKWNNTWPPNKSPSGWYIILCTQCGHKLEGRDLTNMYKLWTAKWRKPKKK